MDNKIYRDFDIIPTEFSRYEDEYYLNKDGGLSLYPAKRDCQAVIDSYIETVFQQILDEISEVNYMSENAARDFIAEREAYATDLDMLIEADRIMEAIRSENNLEGMDQSQIINYLREKVNEEFTEREVQSNEKKAFESKNESNEFQENGKEST